MLKHGCYSLLLMGVAQPPLGGCVLKQPIAKLNGRICTQPPLGGCVLKPIALFKAQIKTPAAFRRLCVETVVSNLGEQTIPASRL